MKRVVIDGEPVWVYAEETCGKCKYTGPETDFVSALCNSCFDEEAFAGWE